MNKVDNRRILYDCQDLATHASSNLINPHWPKVLVTGAMKNSPQANLPSSEHHKNQLLPQALAPSFKRQGAHLALKCIDICRRILGSKQVVKHD
ncbi:hypothetical protein [Flavobacterium sp. W21_SRS_FM6]|uniref:hypothetical protein n=1 Tax=Flavobacterium sp. W21_SRS_FM6 TaxID=3240268 RepID=UPI003F913FAF